MTKPRVRTGSADDEWVRELERDVKAFAATHGFAYSFKDRELSAAFEIGCFLVLLMDYERQGCTATPIDLVNGEFRYLTSPTGNPANFSHVNIAHPTGVVWELRQQVRVVSSVHPDIYFSPDIVVVDAGTIPRGRLDPDYANGQKKFFSIPSTSIVSLYECKSLVGFPELYVSFLGMVLSAHPAAHVPSDEVRRRGADGHLASTLFVGGSASNLHRKMITALENQYRINIVTGVHRGGWVVARNATKAHRLLIPGLPLRDSKGKRTIKTARAEPAAVTATRAVRESEIPF